MYNTVVYVMMAFIFWCESKAQKSSNPVAKNYEQRDCFFLRITSIRFGSRTFSSLRVPCVFLIIKDVFLSMRAKCQCRIY